MTTEEVLKQLRKETKRIMRESKVSHRVSKEMLKSLLDKIKK